MPAYALLLGQEQQHPQQQQQRRAAAAKLEQQQQQLPGVERQGCPLLGLLALLLLPQQLQQQQ
jgi:hypothetical protein